MHKLKLERRHFCAIAAVLADSRPTGQIELEMIQWQFTVRNFVGLCRISSPRFDKERFLAACNKVG